MCASWRIPADDGREEVVITMLVRDEVSIVQNGGEVVLAPRQLTDIADKLYFLDQAFQANVGDALEVLCG